MTVNKQQLTIDQQITDMQQQCQLFTSTVCSAKVETSYSIPQHIQAHTTLHWILSYIQTLKSYRDQDLLIDDCIGFANFLGINFFFKQKFKHIFWFQILRGDNMLLLSDICDSKLKISDFQTVDQAKLANDNITVESVIL